MKEETYDKKYVRSKVREYTYGDVAERIHKKTKLPRRLCKVLLNGFFAVFEEVMAEGNAICIPNIGRFWIRTYPPKKYWDGIRGQYGTTGPRSFVKFRASPKFKKSINKRHA